MGMKPLLLIALGLFVFRAAADEGKPLNFEEVFNLIRTNITDMTEEELNRTAAIGLIKELGTKVQLVTTNAEAATQPPDAITKRAVFEEHFGYIRIRSVDERLPSDFHQTLTRLVTSNALKGLVLDLRYAEGTNYEAAAAVADEFVKAGEALVRLGAKEIRGTDQTKTIQLPTAILVNNETRAAAEAIAAILRESAAGLIIGKRTAGEARLFEIFTLRSGQQLRVGKVPVEVGAGKAIPASGIVPDIDVPVDPTEEKFFYLDPYRERKLLASGASTNEVAGATNRTRRLNEAELVRRHRGEIDFNEETPPARAEVPVINDPTLGRALDFLKGLAILQPRKPL
jgi:carboxyl-terminal processing protease